MKRAAVDCALSTRAGPVYFTETGQTTASRSRGTLRPSLCHGLEPLYRSRVGRFEIRSNNQILPCSPLQFRSQGQEEGMTGVATRYPSGSPCVYRRG